MQLVEIIPAVQTKAGLAEEVKEMVKSWGKFPVIVKILPALLLIVLLVRFMVKQSYYGRRNC
jgi:3-hydroxyacyl-CoA dehydrogenase